MSKYLKLFETTSQYEAYIKGSDVVLPNVSVAKDDLTKVYYSPWVEPPFFAKLTLNNGEVVELEGRGQLTGTMISSYKSTLVSAEIGELCTSIGQFAFSGCKGLTNITIPDSVTSIDIFVFQSCSSLTSITIPDSVTSINYNVFIGCKGLTNVTIGSGVTSIEDGAFSGCSSLTSIVVNSANTVYDSRDNCNAIIKTSTNELIVGCNNTVIPESVTSIGSSAFSSRTGLTSITIPDSVTSIGSDAFNACSSLTSITIPSGVTSIGSGAFNSCSGLTSMVVDSANTVYDSRDNCNAIINTSTNELIVGCKNTVIPNTVTSIGNYAFYGCTGLTSIAIPDRVTSIGNYAFRGCTGLTSIAIPDRVTSIGNYAFYNCTGLTSITIPDSVTSIGGSAFYECIGLTSVIIGSGVISIGGYAFNNCTGLTSITSLAAKVPTIESSTFKNVKTNGTLKVPIGSSGYSVWMGTGNYYLGKYNWTKVEQ